MGSGLKGAGWAYLTFVRYGVGGVLIAAGASIMAGSLPIYLKPLGLGFALSGAVLLPVVGARLARLSKQFEPPRMPFILAGAMFWGGVVLSAVTYNVWEKAHPEIAAKKAADRKAKAEVAAAQERDEAARLAREEQAAALAKRGDRQRALNEMWGQVTAQMEPCEKSQQYLAEVLGRPGALVQSYQMATQGQQVCLHARTGIQQIKAPDALSERAAKLTTEGLALCADAMLARLTFMSIAVKVIDGDRRPSRLAEAQVQNQAAGAITLQCVAKLTEAGLTDGLKLEKR
jgi:hypothetical protein